MCPDCPAQFAKRSNLTRHQATLHMVNHASERKRVAPRGGTNTSSSGRAAPSGGRAVPSGERGRSE